MTMYNLIEYSNNYSDTSGSLWQFRRDEIEGNVDLTVYANHIPNNSSSYKYKSSDCNWTRTQNHLVLKRTLNHLAKLVSLSQTNQVLLLIEMT